MSGIVFLKTGQLAAVRDFYCSIVGCSVWLDQRDCIILRHGNLLFGFCERDTPQCDLMLTFFFANRRDVDRMYNLLAPQAESAPAYNDRYRIYQFFARDPEGRALEFQHFDHEIPPHNIGDEMLRRRRSIRSFEDRAIDRQVLTQIVDSCRYAPSSRNSQPCYFKFITDLTVLAALAKTRGDSSAPISRAPMAVAICADPALSKRHIQDACIMAYHFLLAAFNHGLGTCWIAAMDRDDVKVTLGIPHDHYIATVTPLGYPAGELPDPSQRKPVEDLIR
ncbi:MAG: nitroreductase family protein [candidate division Zixibacteria bacterium]|nr:nitroreductase family protein [candidate division Zixibacteria bacterium]